MAILSKINSSGTLTSYTCLMSGGSSNVITLTYNKFVNKLYSIVSFSADSTVLLQINISGTSFTFTSCVTTTHPIATNISPDPVTADNTTGNIYLITGTSGSNYYIEKFAPGSASSSVVANGSAPFTMLGMRFNSSDNLLYAISNVTTSSGSFISINPSTGTITTLAPLAIHQNLECYSACIDPCTNHYIFSSFYATPAVQPVVYQLNMAGSVVQIDTPSVFISGLTTN